MAAEADELNRALERLVMNCLLLESHRDWRAAIESTPADFTLNLRAQSEELQLQETLQNY